MSGELEETRLALDLWRETHALLQGLEEGGIAYALVGAVALAIHGVPRATADIDLLVQPTDLAGALAAAGARGFRLEALPMRFADGMEMRRVSKIEGEDTLTLDLIPVNPNLEPVWESRRRVETGGGGVWVVSRQALIQMKLQAGREQDLADVRRLEELDR